MTRIELMNYALAQLQEATFRHNREIAGADYYYRIVIASCTKYLSRFDRLELEGIQFIAQMGLEALGK